MNFSSRRNHKITHQVLRTFTEDNDHCFGKTQTLLFTQMRNIDLTSNYDV